MYLLSYFPAEVAASAAAEIAHQIEQEQMHAETGRLCARCVLLELMAAWHRHANLDVGWARDCGKLTLRSWQADYLTTARLAGPPDWRGGRTLAALEHAITDFAGYVTLSEPVNVLAGLRAYSTERSHGR